MPITITAPAIERVIEARAQEHEPDGLALWVEIVGVAGSAYQYDMSFLRHDEIDETDVVVELPELMIVVPRLDAPALDQATIDVDGALGGGLVIDNPKSPMPTSPALSMGPVPELAGPVADRVRIASADLQVNPRDRRPRRKRRLVAVEDSRAPSEAALGGGCVGWRHVGCDAPQEWSPRSSLWCLRSRVVVDVTDHAAGTNPATSPDGVRCQG
jgi:Fe-S cluster assembly iron-binding protein IscA